MKNLMIFSFAVLLLWGCSKSDLQPTNVSDNDLTTNKDEQSISLDLLDEVTFEDGRLIFTSKEQVETVTNLLTTDETFEQAFKESFPEFISANDAYEAITDEMIEQNGTDTYEDIIEVTKWNDRETIEPEISMNAPSLIANQNGIFQIGDKVLKFTYDNIYQFDIADLQMVKEGRLNSSSSLEVYEITRNVSSSRYLLAFDDDEYGPGNNRRVSGAIYRASSSVYSDVDARIVHERRIRGSWRKRDAKTLSIDGSVEVTLGNGDSKNGGYDGDRNNRKDWRVTMVSAWWTTMSIDELNTNFKAQDDGSTGEFDIVI